MTPPDYWYLLLEKARNLPFSGSNISCGKSAMFGNPSQVSAPYLSYVLMPLETENSA